jgi:hypothetical protein
VFPMTIIFFVRISPNQLPPILVMADFRYPRWVYGVPLNSIESRHSRRRARGPYSDPDGGAGWEDPISQECRLVDDQEMGDTCESGLKRDTKVRKREQGGPFSVVLRVLRAEPPDGQRKGKKGKKTKTKTKTNKAIT